MEQLPFVIAVNAISGGGKTTITKTLLQYLPNAKAIFFDDRDYDTDSGIDNICEWIDAGADVNLFDLSLLVLDIEEAASKQPQYIILDYPFGYRHKLIADIIDFSVFIDTPLDIALARRILRDYTDKTISGVFSDLRQYLDRGRGAYIFGLEETLAAADFVADGTMPIDELTIVIAHRAIAHATQDRQHTTLGK